MPPAARISDMHVCPKVEPGPVPHVGGPTSSGESTVIIGGMPAARIGDSLVCLGGPPDSISQGESTVIIGGKPAARLGDGTSHGGVLVMGCPTVIIGSSAQAQTVVVAARDGTPFCEECEKRRREQEAAQALAAGSPAESPEASSSSGPPATAPGAVAALSSTAALVAPLVDDITHWPPRPPQGKPPGFDAPNAAEWRYNRYRHNEFTRKKKTRSELLDFETYKKLHFNAAAKGGRPGRSGGSDQVRTRRELEEEGFTNVETVSLNGKYVDLIRNDNASGGTDYVEVDSILKKGTPIKRLRDKLKIELGAIKEGDKLIYVDKSDSSKRIIYEYGENPDVIDVRIWKE